VNNETKWQTLMERWHHMIKVNPEWRKGQALMNALYEVDRDLSKFIVDEYFNDCYYLDSRIHDTLSCIANQYNVIEGR